MHAPLTLQLVMIVTLATISSTGAFTFKESKVAGDSNSEVVGPANVLVESKELAKAGSEVAAIPAPVNNSVQQTDEASVPAVEESLVPLTPTGDHVGVNGTRDSLTIAEPAPAATGATDETVKHTTDTLIDASATPEPTIPTSNETEGFENSGDVTVLPNNPTDEATTKSSTTAQTEPPVKDSSHSSIPPTGKRPCPPLPQPKTPCPPLPQPKTPCPPLPQPKTPCPPLPQPKTPCPPLPRPKETAGSIDESMQEQQGSDKTKVKASTAAGGIVFGHALIVVSTIITYLLL